MDTNAPALPSSVCHLLFRASGAPADSLSLQFTHLSIFCTQGFPFFPLSLIMYLIILYYILSSISIHLELGVVMVGAVFLCHDLLFRIFPSRVTSKINLWFYFCFIFGRFWCQGYALFIKLIRKFLSCLYPPEHFK